MEPLEKELLTGIHKTVVDEAAQRKPGGGQWTNRPCLREEAGKETKVWQTIEVD
jgi:hypothetical protein